MSEKRTTDTRSLDESLIDLVRVNPLLFEKSKRIKPYESMKERSELWKSIATSLGVEPNFCVARWKQLCERYRREIIKKHELEKSKEKSQPVDEWPLMEKMRFLDKHTKQHHHYNYKLPIGSQPVSSGASTTETSRTETTPQIFGGVNYDEPLPEAMDEQPLSSSEAASRRNIALPTSTQGEQSGIATNPILVRVEALLGGLDAHNRSVAEKRILSYLCKCQLKMLDGENIDDVQL